MEIKLRDKRRPEVKDRGGGVASVERGELVPQKTLNMFRDREEEEWNIWEKILISAKGWQPELLQKCSYSTYIWGFSNSIKACLQLRQNGFE